MDKFIVEYVMSHKMLKGGFLAGFIIIASGKTIMRQGQELNKQILVVCKNQLNDLFNLFCVKNFRNIFCVLINCRMDGIQSYHTIKICVNICP